MLSRCHAGPTPAKMRFSCDSPLEQRGFEPSVSLGQPVLRRALKPEAVESCAVTTVQNSFGQIPRRTRWFCG